MKVPIVVLGTILFLTACGGSSSTPPTLPPELGTIDTLIRQRTAEALTPTASPTAGGASMSATGNTARAAYVGVAVDDTGEGIHQPIGQRIGYEKAPPIEGDHWAEWAGCGNYDEEINDEYMVHNMEHGHVIISYNLSNPEDVRRLRELAEDLPGLDNWGVVRPYSGISEGTVTMTAWGVLDQVEGVDQQRIRAFYEDNIRNFNSPETAAIGPIPCGQ